MGGTTTTGCGTEAWNTTSCFPFVSSSREEVPRVLVATGRFLECGGDGGGDHAPFALRCDTKLRCTNDCDDDDRCDVPVAIESDRGSIAGMKVSSAVSACSLSRFNSSNFSSFLFCQAPKSLTERFMDADALLMLGLCNPAVSSRSRRNALNFSNSTDSAFLCSNNRCLDSNVRESVIKARLTLVIPNDRPDSKPPIPLENSRE